jgi:predicted O-methyltransferase YrrM
VRDCAPDLAAGASVDGLLQDVEGACLYALARRAAGLGNVVEIGAFKGRSTWFLARALDDAESPYRVVSIDPHLEGTAGAFAENMRRTGADRRVDARAAFSHDVAPMFDEPIGLLWIDGDHGVEAVRRDFEDWYPRLGVGGYIAFHDTVNHWHGPTKLVRELLVKRDDLVSVGVMGTITYARKAPPSLLNRPRAVVGRAGFEVVTLLRGLRVGRGPVNEQPGER